MKREIKRSGNKKVRSKIKHDLATNPEEAHLTDYDYDGSSSKKMNGMDHDATRCDETKKGRYNQANRSIMAQEGPNDEELSVVRDGEQGSGESLPELCPPLHGGDSEEGGKVGEEGTEDRDS